MCSHPLQADSEPSISDWRQIDNLLDEIAEQAFSVPAASDFYALILHRIVPAIGATGGAIWSMPQSGELRLEAQRGLTAGPQGSRLDALAIHQTLVEATLAGGQPQVVHPQPAGTTEQPTDTSDPGWLILHPFQPTPEAKGVVELIQRNGLSAAAGRCYLQLLAAVGEVINEYHRRRELDTLRRRDDDWRDFDRFARTVHRSLDAKQSAFAIANDGRRIIDCDRLSVLVCRGNRARATAISGVDTLDRRAKQVRALERLAGRVVAGGDCVSFSDGTDDLPEQIERPLHEYLDESHARTIAIVPLMEPASDAKTPPRTIGVLVAERFQSGAADAALRERATAVADHSAVALHNALVHSRLPLSSVGRALARLPGAARGGRLAKWLAVGALLVAGAAALTWLPADFDIEARGELQPKYRRDVFASDTAVVDELLVDHAQAVRADEPLVVLRKPELDLEARRIAGEIQTNEKKLAAVQAERLDNLPTNQDTRRGPHQLTADEEELKERLIGLNHQRAVLDQQRRDLIVRSPLDGQALTWKLKERLLARPVERGQALLSVADMDGPWVVELHVSDHRSGHVLAAREAATGDLDVSFALLSDPGREYQGHITDVALATDVDDSDGATVLVTVDFDRDAVEGLRAGATVMGKIHCGRRALGYVWFHELFETIQSHWWW